MTRSPQTNAPPDAAARRRATPVIVYAVERLPPFSADLYNAARSELTKVSELLVPPRDGRAFNVPAGHFFRIISVEGPQVGDLNLWNLHDLSERFFSGKTRAFHATHVSTGDRLWSTLPGLRACLDARAAYLRALSSEGRDSPRTRILAGILSRTITVRGKLYSGSFPCSERITT